MLELEAAPDPLFPDGRMQITAVPRPAVPVPRAAVAAARTTVVDLSVVIPAFNEQRRIQASVEKVAAYLDLAGHHWELIIVDDGSTDGTADVARRLAEGDSRIKLVQLARNGGKGRALRAGVLATQGVDVLISDADLSTPISELDKLWAAGRDVAVAIGSRARPVSAVAVRYNPVRKLLARAGNRYIRLVAVPGIRDTQCGFKLLRGHVARTLMARARLNGWGIDVEILHLCARFGWPVAEIPVQWQHVAGSKVRPIAYLQVLAEVAYVRLVHRRVRAAQAPDWQVCEAPAQATSHHCHWPGTW